MALSDFKGRWANNVLGKFYVGDRCLDCSVCIEIAPLNFARDNDGGFSFVKKQPENDQELALCVEAAENCHMSTIKDDGDRFDAGRYPGVEHQRLVKDPPERDVIREKCCAKRPKPK